LIRMKGTEHDGGLLGQMQDAADWWKSNQGPDSVWHDYFTNDYEVR